MNVEYVPINEIRIGDRERLDYGDIEGFAKELDQDGLMNPIILNKDGEVVDGGRRLEAFKFLGHKEIPCIIRGEGFIDDKLLELVANTQRKPFTDYELTRMIPKLRKLYESDKLRYDSYRRTRFREWVSSKMNIGSTKFSEMLYIEEHASAEDLEKLRSGETSVNKLYKAVKKREDGEPAKKKKRKPEKKPEPKPTGPCISYCPLKAEDFIYEVAYTFRLDPGDPRWNNVIAYIESHSEKPM